MMPKFLRYLNWPIEISSPEGSFPHTKIKPQVIVAFATGFAVFMMLCSLNAALMFLWHQPHLVRWLPMLIACAAAALAMGWLRERYPSGLTDGAWKGALVAFFWTMVEPAIELGSWLGSMIIG